ncbi:SanA/YdcF family protein [Nocardia jiangxiensis]|uniref:Vancomycin high temperature exclusion protein n=1 Tax=Nocardia jiangxiensis TaxID=282685 RepID=A0ABW6S2R4_9NOCA|nr:ElyC/SanA/YdcF family protein [Nocardia jiangxiensis]
MSPRDTPSGVGAFLRPWLRPKVLLRVAVVAALTVMVLVGVCIGVVRWRASGPEYSATSVPPADVALVPGAEIYPNGQPSPYVAGRLDLARTLLNTGKVQALLLTGDFGTPTYDEPDAMRRYLIDKGVPANKIALDYAGFDTYQSCARAYRIFGVRNAIVVTQDFSVPRTIALCRSVGIRTTAVGDHSQAHNLTYDKCWVRDQIAAIKAVYSMLVQPDPKFLGRQETSVRDAIAASPH